MQKILGLGTLLLANSLGAMDPPQVADVPEAAEEQAAVEAPFAIDVVQKDFEEYQALGDNDPQKKIVKVRIVSQLNNPLLIGRLSDDERKITIDIAKGIGAATLAIRLEGNKVGGNLSPLSKELVQEIVNRAVKGEPIKKLKEWLTVSKGFNQALMTAPVKLDLGYKAVTDEVLEKILMIFPNVSQLDLDHTPVTDAGMKYLEKIESLKDLDLSNLQITAVGLQSVGKLKNLEKLDIFNTEVTNDGLKELGRLTKLTDLNLAFSYGSTDAGLVHLEGLKNLSHLSLPDDLTKGGIEQLKKALPNCTIVRRN